MASGLAGVEEESVPRREAAKWPAVGVSLAPDPCGLQQSAVAALPQHGGIVEDEGCLVIVGPEATHVAAIARVECCAELVQLLLEDGDQRPAEELPAAAP